MTYQINNQTSETT